MKNSSKSSHKFTLNYIPLNSYSTANPTAAVIALRNEWNSIQSNSNLKEFIASNITARADKYSLNPRDLYGMELDECVSEVWLDMNNRFNDPQAYARFVNAVSNKLSKGVSQVNLLFPLWQSIDAVFKRTLREKAIFKKITNVSGEVVTEQITMEVASDSVMLEHQSNSVSFEDQVITSVAVRQVMNKRDRIDQIIAELAVYGYSDREIGKLIGKSGVTVGKRRDKMKADFRAAGLR